MFASAWAASVAHDVPLKSMMYCSWQNNLLVPCAAPPKTSAAVADALIGCLSPETMTFTGCSSRVRLALSYGCVSVFLA